MDAKLVQQALNEFGTYVVERARGNLKTGGKYGTHNTTGALSKSLNFKTKVSKNSMAFDFYADEHWKYLDYGVQGKISGSKAPNSPFKYGSGTGKKGGLTRAIDSWVVRKGLSGTRNEKGQFTSRKSLVMTIVRSIYLKGTPETKFFRSAFDIEYKKFDEIILEKYGLDLETFLKFTLKDIK